MDFEGDSSTESESGVNEPVAMELATGDALQDGIQDNGLQPLNFPENLEGEKASQQTPAEIHSVCYEQDETGYERFDRQLLARALGGLSDAKDLLGTDFYQMAVDGALDGMMEVRMLDTIRRLNRDFLRWRHRILRKNYRRNCISNERKFSPKRMREYIATAGTKQGDRELPSPDLFQKVVAPTICSMVHTAEDFERVAKDVFETMELLMVGELSHTTHSIQGGLMCHFFTNDNSDPEYGDYWGHCAKGQFKYYYQKYGKWPAMAVAIHQGWECDRHYGDGSYINSVGQLENVFGEIFALPADLRDAACRAFVQYGGHHQAQIFLRAVPQLITGFTEGGRPDLLPKLFQLLESAPAISPDSSPSGRDRCEGFPLLEPKKALDEMQAYDDLPKDKELVFGLACDLLRVSGRGSNGIAVTFGSQDPDADRGWRFAHQAHVNVVVGKLRSEGYDDDKMCGILAIPRSCPWLGSRAVDILENYAYLDARFPGGCNRLLDYLAAIKSDTIAVSSFVGHLTDGDYDKLSPEAFACYLDCGRELVAACKRDVQCYFQGPRYMLGLFAMLESGDLAAFRKCVEHGSEMMKVVRCNDWFAIYLRHFDDPEFEKFNEGVKIIAGQYKVFLATLKSHGRGDSYHNTEGVRREILRAYCQRFEFERWQGSFMDLARVLCYFAFDCGDPYLQGFHLFEDKVLNGFDPKLAAVMEYRYRGGQLVKPFGPIPGVECPAPLKMLEPIFDSIRRAREIVDGELHPSDRSLSQEKYRSLPAQLVDELNGGLLEISRLPSAEVDGVSSVRAEIEGILALDFFRRHMKVAVVGGGVELNEFYRDTLDRAAPATRSLVSAISLLLALGSTRIPGIEMRDLEPVLAQGARGYDTRLRRNMAKVVPLIIEAILRSRSVAPGLMPVGAKVHTPVSMNSSVFETARNLLGLDSTSFRLIHANDSLILPPSLSAFELKLWIQLLGTLGVIDKDRPEIQVTNGVGHLPEELAAIVGASVLLATERGRRFSADSFETTHPQTGARIMAYDAGIKQYGMPFDIAEATGRTDMLGRRRYSDIDTVRLLATLACHAQHGEMFADLMRRYGRDFLNVLRAGDLDRDLRSSAWVYDNAAAGDSLERHGAMLGRFTDAWFESRRQPDFGLIGLVRRMIGDVAAQVVERKKDVIAERPQDYERLLEL